MYSTAATALVRFRIGGVRARSENKVLNWGGAYAGAGRPQGSSRIAVKAGPWDTRTKEGRHGPRETRK